jgi:hypothetical protein
MTSSVSTTQSFRLSAKWKREVTESAFTAGTLRIKAGGHRTAASEAAAFARLQHPSGTGVPGSEGRGCTPSASGAGSVDCDGYIVSDGSARTLSVQRSAEGSTVTPRDVTMNVWLL